MMPRGHRSDVATPIILARSRPAILDDADFSSGCPRQAVNFRDGLEFDEAAFYRLEGFNLFLLARSERSGLDGLAKVRAIIAHVKFVALDGAVVRFVLPWQIGEAFDDGGRNQFEDDFMGKAGAVALPLGVPNGVGVAIHRVFSVTVLAVDFLAVHFYELKCDVDGGADFGWPNIRLMTNGSRTTEQSAAQNEREAEEKFGVYHFNGLVSKLVIAALAASATETRLPKLLLSLSFSNPRRLGSASRAFSFSRE